MGGTGAAEKRSSLTRYLVSELMRGEREIILEHRGQDYRLRITMIFNATPMPNVNAKIAKPQRSFTFTLKTK